MPDEAAAQFLVNPTTGARSPLMPAFQPPSTSLSTWKVCDEHMVELRVRADHMVLRCIHTMRALITWYHALNHMVAHPTAYGFLEVLQVPEGGWLLQAAGGSTLGRLLIALAKRRSVRTISLVRRRAQVQELLDLGWAPSPGLRKLPPEPHSAAAGFQGTRSVFGSSARGVQEPLDLGLGAQWGCMAPHRGHLQPIEPGVDGPGTDACQQ